MVQQAYIHRLALGRSAFEAPAHSVGGQQSSDAGTNDQLAVIEDEPNSSLFPQAYDSRGNPLNPASRTQARRIIRAYNEVLATVGVCARVENEGRNDSLDQTKGSSRKMDQAITSENETGFWLNCIDESLCMVTTTAFVNLRRRIQTFDIYSGISLLDIFNIEFSYHGAMQVLFAGEFAHRIFCLLWVSGDVFIEMGREILINRFVTSQRSKHRRRFNSRAIHAGERLLKLALFYALYPIQLYAGLQRLYLIPLWPLLPSPFSTSFFCFSLPPALPLTWDGASLISWCIAIIKCPATIFLGMQLFSARIAPRLTRYALSTITRPDNPDDASFRISQDELFEGQEWVFNRLRYQTSLRAELRKDIASVRQTFMDLDLQLRNAWRRYILGKRPTVGFPDDMSHEALPDMNTIPIQLPEAQDSISPVHTPAPLVIPSSATIPPNSPLLTPISSNEENDLNDANTSNVRIRARAGSTSTLHMDVEFTTTDEIGGPIHTSSFASSPHPRSSIEIMQTGSTPQPYHRVTALSMHAAESLSVHTMGILTMFLRLPMESFYIRSITRNFLRSQQTSGWLIQHVYPSKNWFGLGLQAGWPLMVDYSGKIMLCSFLELLAKMQIWQVSCRTALWLGTRYYGWGKL